MSDSIDIYAAHLTQQMSEDAPHVESAVYDPSGDDVIFYGFFDENSSRGIKDSANVKQKNSGPRFIISDLGTISADDVYEDKELFIDRLGLSYTIEYIETDDKGVQVLWLR